MKEICEMSGSQMSNEEAWNYAIGLVKVDGLEPTPDIERFTK
jgi:hypothetical protein